MNLSHTLPVGSKLCPNPVLCFGYGSADQPMYRQCSTCGRYFDTAGGTLTPVRNPTTPPPTKREYLHVKRLRSTLAKFISEDFYANGRSRQGSWSVGLDHGKYFVGNALLDALEHSGCDRKAELDTASR